MAFSADDRERLSKLLAMFSSTFDGEILNAAKAAERLIKARGETWESVIVFSSSQRRETPRPSHQQKRRPYRSDFQDDIDACLVKANLLTPWERQFLTDISDRMTLSEKQRALLERVKAKIAAYSDMNF